MFYIEALKNSKGAVRCFCKNKRWLHRPKAKEVPLESLAKLWTDDVIDNDSGKLGHIAEALWISREINSFYRTYIAPYNSSLVKALPVVCELLTILDKHGDNPSTTEYHIDKAFDRISLRDHTLRVARIAMDMIRKNHRDDDLLLSKVLITTLAHDIGIPSSENVLGGTHMKSLLMIGNLISDLPYKDSIIEAIQTFVEDNPRSELAKILKATNSAAREQELNKLRLLDKENSHSDIAHMLQAINIKTSQGGRQ